MPEAARHFVECAWLSATAPPLIDIHTAALQNIQRSLPPLDSEE